MTDRAEEPLRRLNLAHPLHFLALGFGAGLARRAPGTFGTLAAIPVYFLVQLLPLPGYALVTAIMALAGIAICGRAAHDLGVHDHPSIVWDEVVGYLITMFAAPPGWAWVVGGFVAFRFFDILKPWPIRVLDRRIGGGLGIMLDDVVAGFAGLAVLGGARYFWG